MSTPQHPVGRPSPAVYRRRRLVVLLGLIVVVVLMVLLIARPWRGSARPVAAQTSAPATTAASSPTPTSPAATPPTATASPTPTASATPKPTATPAGVQPCDPAAVDVQAITDASVYSAKQRPLLSLSLTDTGSQACTIDAGTAAMVLTVSSGGDQWWTSTDCQVDAVHTVIKLLPHKTLTSAPIAWDRTRSSKTTCNSKNRPKAPAGGSSYHLSVSIDGIASKTTKQFILNG
jgi:hypothetical protein